MTIVKYIMMALSGVATILCISTGILSAGTQGYILLVMCALPLAQGGLSLVQKTGLKRSQSVANLVAFMIAAMKTREGDEFQNIMMAAFFGAILAIVMIIKPEGGGASDDAEEAAPAEKAAPAPAADPAPADDGGGDDGGDEAAG